MQRIDRRPCAGALRKRQSKRPRELRRRVVSPHTERCAVERCLRPRLSSRGMMIHSGRAQPFRDEGRNSPRRSCDHRAGGLERRRSCRPPLGRAAAGRPDLVARANWLGAFQKMVREPRKRSAFQTRFVPADAFQLQWIAIRSSFFATRLLLFVNWVILPVDGEGNL